MSKKNAVGKNKGKKGVQNGKNEKVKGDLIDPHELEITPLALFRGYSAFCQTIGILAHDEIRRCLMNVDHPNNGRQILITKSANEKVLENDGFLGPGQCRALSMAILGKYEGGNNRVYTTLLEIRIVGSCVTDDGAEAIADILRLGGSRLQLSLLELADAGIGVRGAEAIGRAFFRGVCL